MLFAMLGECYRRAPHPTRDEIVIAESGHESNVAPWVKLGDAGYRVRWWRLDRERQTCPIEELERLLSDHTRLVALPHVSNLLGAVEDLPRITALAHRAGARVVVDGVAYAPHRPLDVAAWGVDWYVYSVYKVYGPHMAALFGTHEALAEVEGPNFFFVAPTDVPYKLELGGVLHEGCAGIVGLWDYLCFLAAADPADAPAFDREVIDRAYAVMWAHEQPLQQLLIEYLRTKPAVTLIGPAATDERRVPTVSFVHRDRSSKEIVLAANTRGLGIRYGHFYAHRLAAALGLDPADGVVRTSMLHYNSADEVARLIATFEELL